MKTPAAKPTPLLNTEPDKIVRLNKEESYFITKVANLFYEEMKTKMFHKHLSELSEAEIRLIIATIFSQESEAEYTDYIIPGNMLYHIRCLLFDFDVMLSESELHSMNRDIHPIILDNFSICQKIRVKFLPYVHYRK